MDVLDLLSLDLKVPWACPGCKRQTDVSFLTSARWIKCACGYEGEHPGYLRRRAGCTFPDCDCSLPCGEV
jgi:hypothetical protein